MAANKIFVNQTGALQQQPRPQEVIRAERIELVDANGKARIVLGTERFGFETWPLRGIGIFILDDEAKPIAALGIEVSGAPVLQLRGQNGSATLATGHGALTNRGPALMLISGTNQASLSVRGDQDSLGEAALNLASKARSSDKETEIDLETTKHLGATLSLTFTDHSSESEKSVGLRATPYLPYLNISSGKEIFSGMRRGKELSQEEINRRLIAQARIGLGIESGGPHLSMTDQNGNLRTVLGTTQLKDSRTGSVETRSPSSLVLFGENGTVIWQAP